ncbi:uncharacterized protein SPPG_09399 [Spizellomyces punctatus DAOM BR117]|uniref:DUF4042 domain-containing protein n=1 Tax=Spizellomyces punctatus (strain DAOM BR117) TaxID=645134 RepID=A0A0L0HBS3_SPIPD|nr:uncharacterized protein SPPG_09399 [Spizellomyces punctatus DAOM BR117]KNC98329.1 hypothetical protein SPPG_09399 [Spizellomyces punctatus DAOM BR117]|eukprot:XP_016606369.1 hypothetical protein SPPG_09399 [Spizellomyces punctatus DAOM BR117]
MQSAAATFDGLVVELTKCAPPIAGQANQESKRISILGDLVALSYPVKACSAENVRKLVVYGRKYWNHPPANGLFTDLLFQLFSKQKISLPTLDIQQEVIGQCVDFLLSALKSTGIPGTSRIDGDLRLNVLRTLGTVLFENGAACFKSHSALLNALTPLASEGSTDDDPEVRRMALTCLGNLCVKTGTKGANLQKEVYNILMRNLVGDVSEENTSKVVSSALRGLQLLINENKTLVQDSAPTLLSFLQQYGLALPTNSHSFTTTASAKLIKKPPRSLMTIPSDSEFSDGEIGLPRNRLRDSRLQLNAILCLQALAKAQAKLVYPYWFRFLPDPVEGPSAPSLISVMRDSESPKVRHAACAALMAFLEGSKQYLSVAEDSTIKTAFTSLSQKLAEQLREIHQGLLKAVKEETQPLLLTQELKCLGVLIKNCTYDRLRHNYRQDAYDAVTSRITPEDFGITSSVLECIAALLDAGTPLFSTPQADGLYALLDMVMALAKKPEHISVRVAALDVLCSVARNAPDVIGANWSKLVDILVDAETDAKDAVRAAALKLLEQYTHSCGAKEGVQVPPLNWWTDLVDHHVQTAIQDTFYAVRSLGCDCLSHFPSIIFENLPPKRQYACLALALGMVQDEDHTVRAAACRTLGVYVSHPAVMEDVLFLNDVATTIPQLATDKNINVRIRTSWALANLCDALASVGESAQKQGVDLAEVGITHETVVEIIRAGLAAAKDNDKCRSNGVRALGNIVRVCPPMLLVREAERLIKEIVLVVLKNVDSGSVKARWNACHALGNMLRTDAFPIGRASWTDAVYESLIGAVVTCKNFKVRISAAAAIAGPTTRDRYGTTELGASRNITKSMQAMVTGLENASNLDDAAFGEFKYGEQLSDQLQSTLTHLRNVLGANDLEIRGNEGRIEA